MIMPDESSPEGVGGGGAEKSLDLQRRHTHRVFALLSVSGAVPTSYRFWGKRAGISIAWLQNEESLTSQSSRPYESPTTNINAILQTKFEPIFKSDELSLVEF